MATPFIDVLVPVALDHSYSYRVPRELDLKPGDIVAVPLGARQAIGVVWAGADWLPLKVRRGLNCLVLQIPTPGTYKAFMLPISGNTDSLCLMAVLPLPPSQELDVRAVSLPLPATDVPPHARWDQDGVSRKADPFILIRCPDGVCEIFEQGSVHNSSAPEPGPTATTPHEKRILLAKLWFDEQVLASPTASGPLPQIEPNGPRGTLFPHPDLDSYTVASFTPGVWLPTAGVRVTGGNPNLYRAKLGVEPGPRPDWAAKRGNIFHMCTDTLYTAGGVQSGNPCGVADATRLRCPNGHFFARMFVNNTMKSEFCVMMTKFPANIEVRGVTRWHFLDTDDTVWWRCPRGCCEVQLH